MKISKPMIENNEIAEKNIYSTERVLKIIDEIGATIIDQSKDCIVFEFTSNKRPTKIQELFDDMLCIANPNDSTWDNFISQSKSAGGKFFGVLCKSDVPRSKGRINPNKRFFIHAAPPGQARQIKRAYSSAQIASLLIQSLETQLAEVGKTPDPTKFLPREYRHMTINEYFTDVAEEMFDNEFIGEIWNGENKLTLVSDLSTAVESFGYDFSEFRDLLGF